MPRDYSSPRSHHPQANHSPVFLFQHASQGMYDVHAVWWEPAHQFCFTSLHLPVFCLEELKMSWNSNSKADSAAFSKSEIGDSSSDIEGASADEVTAAISTGAWNSWTSESSTEYNSPRCIPCFNEMSCPVGFKIRAFVSPLWTPASVWATIRLEDSATLGSRYPTKSLATWAALGRHTLTGTTDSLRGGKITVVASDTLQHVGTKSLLVSKGTVMSHSWSLAWLRSSKAWFSNRKSQPSNTVCVVSLSTWNTCCHDPVPSWNVTVMVPSVSNICPFTAWADT